MMSVAPDGRGPIIYTDQVRWYHLIQNSGGTILDFEAQPDGKIWAARIADLSWWDAAEKEWMPVADFPDSNRFVHIDAEGRIWASSFGKTGYYKDGAFHVIPELSGIAANTITLSGNGRIAVNAFNREHSEFYGLYEYDPVPPVKVAEPDRPHSFLNVTAYPNPFNPSVTIQFELQGPEKVEIVIYNIAGQRIRTLANHLFPAGVNRIIWDASTESGERIASGVYFYRAEAGKKARTGKLLLLR